MKTRNDTLLLDASLALVLVANNRIIESKHPYSYSRIWQEPYSNSPYIQFVYLRITEQMNKKLRTLAQAVDLAAE